MRAYIFFFLNIFYIHLIKLYSNKSIISLYVTKVILAPLVGLEVRVKQNFLLFFRNSFFFVYRHSNLEGSCLNGTKNRRVILVVACGPWRGTRSDIGLHDLKRLWIGIVVHMVCVCWGGLDRGWLHSRFVPGVGCGDWSTVGTASA